MIFRGLTQGNKVVANTFKMPTIRKQLLRTFAQVEIPLEPMGDSVSEATVQSFEKNVGEWVDADEVVVVMESDKGEAELRTTEAGVITEFKYEIGDDAEVGDIMFVVDTEAEKPEGQPEPVQEAPQEEAPAQTQQTEAPTQQTQAPAQSSPQQTTSTAGSEDDFVEPVFERAETTEKMSRMRKTIAKRLKDSQNTYASITTFNEIDMHNIIQMRNELGADFEKRHGIRLGFMSIFIKAAAQALKEKPIVNAVMDEAAGEVIYRNFIDISVAVASPKGLVVPVLRDVQNMTFYDVERELRELALKARDGNLSLEEMSGGNFTISNGGVFGSMISAPIINPPQSAILGMHNIKTRPVVVDNEIVARPIMYTAMTYDHRLLDGSEGAATLKRIGDLVEDPRQLLLEL